MFFFLYSNNISYYHMHKGMNKKYTIIHVHNKFLKGEHYNCPGAGVHWCNDCTVSQKISCSYNVQVWKYYYDGISNKNAQNLCNICIPSNVELHISDCNLSLLHWYRWQLPSAKCNVNSLQRKRKQVLEQISLDVKKRKAKVYTLNINIPDIWKR